MIMEMMVISEISVIAMMISQQIRASTIHIATVTLTTCSMVMMMIPIQNKVCDSMQGCPRCRMTLSLMTPSNRNREVYYSYNKRVHTQGALHQGLAVTEWVGDCYIYIETFQPYGYIFDCTKKASLCHINKVY